VDQKGQQEKKYAPHRSQQCRAKRDSKAGYVQ
jgi:hypothetical protein